MAHAEWQTTEVVAWTVHDGPPPAPAAGPRRMWASAAGALAFAFTAIFLTDVICPEYEIWVDPALALTGAGVSIAGLLLGWSKAPLLTVATAPLGIGVGLNDAIHAPQRGGTIAAAFLVAMVVSAWLAARQVRLVAWDRSLLRQVGPTVGPASEQQGALTARAPGISEERAVSTTT